VTLAVRRASVCSQSVTGMSSAVPISFQVTDCEQTEARLTAKVTLDGATFTLVVVEALPQVCPG